MAEKLTRIQCPSLRWGLGLMEWGEETPAVMLEKLRKYHRSQLEESLQILALPDEAFDVDIVRGSIVQHHVRSLQKASPQYQRKKK